MPWEDQRGHMAIAPDDRERFERLFDEHVEVGLHHGAQLAVYDDGELVADLAGGITGPEAEAEAVTPDQRFVFFSSTKPLTGVCVHRLSEEGSLDYDDPVVEYWPEFADRGSSKADVTIRHVLSHQGGFPVGEFDLRTDDWTDWDAVVAAMEEIECSFEPGETAAYHPMNYGWVLGELVRRVTGTPIGEYVESTVFEPLEMDDTFLGLPEEVEDDVATLVAFDEFDRARDPERGLEGDNADAARNFNRESYHRAAMPAASCVGTARDLARFYACLANGGELDGTRVLEEETVERATEVQVEVEQDGTLGVPSRYAMGFVRGGTTTGNYGTLSPSRVFGHAGLGSSVGWADPEGLALAYVTNGIREGYEHAARTSAMADAARRAFDRLD